MASPADELPVCDEFFAAGLDHSDIVILGDVLCITEMMICCVVVMSYVVLSTL